MIITMKIAAFLLAISLFRFWRIYRNIKKSKTSEGIIIDIVHQNFGKNILLNYPVVQYKDPLGEVKSFQINVAASKNQYQKNEKVYVYFQNHPTKPVDILSFDNCFGFWYLMIGISFLLLFISCGFYFGDDILLKFI